MGGPSVDITAPPFPPRRSVYGFIDRQNLPPVLRTFDFASPDTSNAQRYTTTVPQQALFLLNSPFVVQQARSFAGRTEILQAKTIEEKVAGMYQLAVNRTPSPQELTVATQFIADPNADVAGPPALPIFWSYGHGAYDPGHKRVEFTPFPHFEKDTYRGKTGPPDAEIGWAMLTQPGGHPGDAKHMAIRRWKAATAGTVSIRGRLEQPASDNKCGNGIQAWIVSSRAGELGHWQVEYSKTSVRIESVSIEAGDTIDFIVDSKGDVNCDTFQWAPTIELISTATQPAAAPPGLTRWDAAADFAAPPGPPPPPLTALEQYAQALLLTNEFVFVD
jgi:hypothetical protein